VDEELRSPNSWERDKIQAVLNSLNLDWLEPYDLFRISSHIPVACFARSPEGRDYLILNSKVVDESSNDDLRHIILHETLHYLTLGVDFKALEGLAGDIALDIGVEGLIAAMTFNNWKHTPSGYPRFAILRKVLSDLLVGTNPYRLTYPPECESALVTTNGREYKKEAEDLDPELAKIREAVWTLGTYEPYQIYGQLVFFLLEHRPPMIEIPIFIGTLRVLKRGTKPADGLLKLKVQGAEGAGGDETGEGDESKNGKKHGDGKKGSGQKNEEGESDLGADSASGDEGGEGDGDGDTESQGGNGGLESQDDFQPSPVIEEAVEQILIQLGKPGVGKMADVLPRKLRTRLKRRIDLQRARAEIRRIHSFPTDVTNAMEGVLGRELPAPSKLQPYLIRPDRTTQNLMAAGLVPDLIPLFRNLEPKRSKDLIFYFDFSGTMGSYYDSMVLFARLMRQFLPTRIKLFGNLLEEVTLRAFLAEQNTRKWGSLINSGYTNYERPFRDFIKQSPGTSGIMLTDAKPNTGDYSTKFFKEMLRIMRSRGQRMYAFIASSPHARTYGSGNRPKLDSHAFEKALTDWFLIFMPSRDKDTAERYREEIPDW